MTSDSIKHPESIIFLSRIQGTLGHMSALLGRRTATPGLSKGPLVRFVSKIKKKDFKWGLSEVNHWGGPWGNHGDHGSCRLSAAGSEQHPRLPTARAGPPCSHSPPSPCFPTRATPPVNLLTRAGSRRSPSYEVPTFPR
jgi:hypothetical protein